MFHTNFDGWPNVQAPAVGSGEGTMTPFNTGAFVASPCNQGFSSVENELVEYAERSCVLAEENITYQKGALAFLLSLSGGSTGLSPHPLFTSAGLRVVVEKGALAVRLVATPGDAGDAGAELVTKVELPSLGAWTHVVINWMPPASGVNPIEVYYDQQPATVIAHASDSQPSSLATDCERTFAIETSDEQTIIDELQIYAGPVVP